MNILILIESKKLPWSMNKSSKRLQQWFNVESDTELKRTFNFVNIYKRELSEETTVQYYLRLRKLLVENNLIFLVGKRVQRKIFIHNSLLRLPLWCQDKYVGLPHPSQCRNDSLKNIRIKMYIADVIRSKK